MSGSYGLAKDHEDEKSGCVIREVSGLKPWELARVKHGFDKDGRKSVKAKPSRVFVKAVKKTISVDRSKAAKKAWATMRARKAQRGN